MPPTRVLVAEDDPTMLQALAALVDGTPGLELAGTAEDAEEAISVGGMTKPDVALLDVRMPAGGGQRAARELRLASPRTRVVALSGVDDRQTKLDMVLAGAVAYILKGAGTKEIVSTIERAASGEATLSVEITSDMVAAAAKAQEAEIAQRAAEAANAEKTQFLAAMSHELRTPLNSILGFAQLIQLDADEATEELVEPILKAGQHLLGLIDEVLDIARVEVGRLSVSIEPVEVGQAIDSAISLVRPLAARSDITLEEAFEPQARCRVRADLQRLEQVLLNLLSNAVKYNRPGGHVAVSLADGEGRVRISVRDTGLGVAPDKLDRLFTAFDRLGAEQSSVQGTGLGLALAKRLVEAMGGTIGVESKVGEGSVFWVELPSSAPAEPEEALVVVPSAAAAARSAPAGPTKVVYIEDNLANLQLVQAVLTRRGGVTVIPAMQGRLGAELAAEHHPDLVLLDLHLPDIDGEQVLALLRANPETKEIPVMVVSADATAARREALRAAGVSRYLTKPIDVPQFLAAVDATLQRN